MSSVYRGTLYLYTARPSISGTGLYAKDDKPETDDVHYILRFNHLAAPNTFCDSSVINERRLIFF